MAKISLRGTSAGTFRTGSANPGATSMTHSHTVGSGVDRIILVGVAISGYYEGGNPYSVSSATFAGVPLKSAVSRRVTEDYLGLTWQSTTEIWFAHEALGTGFYSPGNQITGSVSIVFNKPLVYDINVASASASFDNVDSRRGALKNLGLPNEYIAPYSYSISSAYPDPDYADSFLQLPLVHYDNGYMFDIIAVGGGLVDGVQTGSAYLKEQYQTPIIRRTISSNGPVSNNRMSMACSTMETLDEPRWGDDPMASEPDLAWSYWLSYESSATVPPPAFDNAYLRYFQHHSHSAVMLWPSVSDYYIIGRSSFPAATVAIATDAPRLAQTVSATSSVESVSTALEALPLTVIPTALIASPVVSFGPPDWWSKYYSFRKQILIAIENEPIPTNHSVQFKINKIQTLSQNKVLSDFSDIIVVYQNGTDIYPAPTNVSQDEDYIYVSFMPVEAIEQDNSNYYVYYGNAKQQYMFNRIAFVELDCPIVSDYNHRFISYLKPGEIWIDGSSREPNSYFSITAPLRALKVSFGKSPASGIIKASLDDFDEVAYDLFSTEQKTAEIISFDKLEPIEDTEGNFDYYHRVNVSISPESNPASSGNLVSLKQIAYRLNFDVSLANEQVYDYGWSVV